MASAECCEPAAASTYNSVGVSDRWGDLNVYINGPPCTSQALLLITDILGWEDPSLRKLADKIASAGYLVVVPDYFHGDAFKWTEDDTFQERLKEWTQRHPPTPEPVEESKQIISMLKLQGMRSIGVAGFSWGAKVTVTLAKEGNIQAAVLLHPALVTCEDIKEVKVPLAILAAEKDNASPPALMKEFQKILILKSEVPHFVKIYAGVSDGWTIRYDLNDEEAVAKAEEAHASLLKWFEKFVLFPTHLS